MTELKKHIQAQNENLKTRGIGVEICEDMAHWAEMGVYTVEEYERYNLICAIWDAYKEEYGFRPRGYCFSEMTTAELEEMYTDLMGNYKAEQDAIEAVCEESGIDRATYDRWMNEAEEPLWKWQEEVEFSHCMIDDIYEVA